MIVPSPASQLIVSQRIHPFSLERQVIELPAGPTIAELLEIAQPDVAIRSYLRVRIQGHDIEPHLYHRVRPKAGVLLEAVPVPQGGNSQLLRTILIIALVAGAMALGGWIAGPALLGMSGVGFAFASAAIGGALTMGGMLALNALIPPPEAEGASQGDINSSPTYSIEGAQNSATLNAPIPLILGGHRFTPRLAAPWRTRMKGSDEYLYGLLCWGYGPASVSAIRIGDTAIERFQGVNLIHYFGDSATSPTFPDYPNQFSSASVGALMGAGNRITRATDTQTVFALLEFQFRSGAMQYSNSTGDALGVVVTMAYRYRLVGGSYSAETQFDLPAKQSTPKRFTIGVQLPSAGVWEFEVRRITGDSTSEQKIDAVHWEDLRSIAPGNPIVNVAGLVFTSIEIKASDQLSGVIRDLNGFVQSYGLQWNSSTASWQYVATKNPAALMRRLLQGTSIKSPVPDSRIDLPQLQYWTDYCYTNSLECNYVIDREMSILEALKIICACGHARPTRVSGKWSVVIDESKFFPAQLFTARNMHNFQMRRIFAAEPHGLRVRFTDETQDFASSERDVYSDGYSAANATEFEEATFPGVTHPDAIYRMGRRRLAEGRLRAESATWECDFEHLVATAGDLVHVQHGAILVGHSTGRIAQVIGDVNFATSFFLDELAFFDTSGDYVMRVRRSDGSQVLLDIIENFGESNQVFLTAPYAQSQGTIIAGDLYAIGIRNREVEPMLIRAIEPTGDLSARITAVPYAPGVFSAPFAPIPPWDPLISQPPGHEAPIIRALVSGDITAVRNPDGSVSVRVALMLWDDGSRPISIISRIEIAWKRADDTSAFTVVAAPADASEVVLSGLPFNTNVRVTARYVYNTGRLGPWGSEAQYFVQGPRIPPLSPFNLIFDGSQLRWSFQPGFDHRGFIVRWSVVPNVAWEEAEGVSDVVFPDYFVDGGEFPIGTRFVLVKAVTINGIESALPGTLAVNITEADQRVTLATVDFGSLGWPGLVQGAEEIAGQLRALDTGIWATPPGGQWIIPSQGLWLESHWDTIVYIANFRTRSDLLPTDKMHLAIDCNTPYKVAYRWGTNDVTLDPFEEPIADDLLAGDMNQPLGTAANAEVLMVWRAWRQGITPMRDEPLQIRVTVAGGGASRQIINSMVLRYDAAEIEETFPGLNFPAVTWVPIPRQKVYRIMRYIVGNLWAGGQGTSMVIDSKDIWAPAAHLVNGAGTVVPGVADVRIGGG